MKKTSLVLISILSSFYLFSQEISPQTQAIVEGIRAINKLNYSDIDEKGKKTSQYFNYNKLIKTATDSELVHYTNDSNLVVKGYVYLALLERKHTDVEKYYKQTLEQKEKVSTLINKLPTTIYLYDFLRSKVYEKTQVSTINSEDSMYYGNLYSNFDSIMIMNYEWKESDVLIDYIIESVSENKSVLTKRKRWLANSYFYHQIAKTDDDYLYGKTCGYPASQPYLRSVVENVLRDSLKSDKVEYFDNWISCDILVVKVYGAEALIRLQNEGAVLTPLQISIVNELKNSYKSIQICSNYFKERKSVRMALSEFEFKNSESN